MASSKSAVKRYGREKKRYYSGREIHKVRIRARNILAVQSAFPEGWSKTSIDMDGLMALFNTLWLKDEYILKAFVFRDGHNGNGLICAMPKDKINVEEVIKRFTAFRGFLPFPKFEDSLDDVMEAFGGDGSFRSYISASILAREFEEFAERAFAAIKIMEEG
jgi:hypothetical protein